MKLGKVYLVGAGPGDPGLITVKGLRLLESAHVVVYDRLVDERLLRRASAGAELIDVGKIPGERRNSQASINALLIEKAREGKRVVRLKGGDPFVFGRGGEEAEALSAAGVPFEVVPGITSAVAAPAYAGIPVTHRKVASSFTVVTGSEDPGKDESATDWPRLARQGDTLVLLMGWQSLKSIVETLVKHGRPPDTPAAVIQWGTEPYQRTVTGTLVDIVERAASEGLAPPVVTVIGEVVALRERLRWFDNRPLFGKRVLVTRTRAQAGELSELLLERGAQPIELPSIEIRPLEDWTQVDRALKRLDVYDWVVFTSVNAVQVVFERLYALGLDARAFQKARVAAIGPATSASLRERGIVADLVPETYVSEAVIEAFQSEALSGKRVLLPRADIARDALTKGMAELGAEVDETAVYHTVTPQDARPRLTEILSQGVDVATFTSSSTVRNLVGMLDGRVEQLASVTIACIGPVTAETAGELGLRVDIVAREYNIPGLVEAMEAYFGSERSSNE